MQVGASAITTPTSQPARVWSNIFAHSPVSWVFSSFNCFSMLHMFVYYSCSFPILHTYERTNNYSKISHEGQKANKSMTSRPLRNFEVNRSLWWTIPLNLEKMWPTLRPSCRFERTPQKIDQTRFVDQEGLLSHSPVFLFNETSESLFFQGRTAWKSISNRSKILVA